MKKLFNKSTSKSSNVLAKTFSLGITCTGLLFTASPSYGFGVTLTPALPTEVPARPNELINFIVSITGINRNEPVTGFDFSINIDGNELSNIEGQNLQISERGLNYTAATQDIKTFSFRVIDPKKDQKSDVFFEPERFTVYYTTIKQELGSTTIISLPKGADVVPVPEPLTLLGSASALVCGILFKRKFKTC